MCRANAIPSAIVVLLAILLPTGPAHGQTCEPLSNGLGCADAACGAIPEDKCLATAFRLDAATGVITTESCACQDFNLCHVYTGIQSFFAGGMCPTGEHCELISTDTNGDGIPDRFASTCRPDPGGICCLDIDDGPLAYDTCEPSGPDACSGVFHDTALGCENIQACCVGSGSESYCQSTHPACCVDSGGVPLGPGLGCPTLGGCPQPCGGIAGIPCPSADEFCMLPAGQCCCDFMGVCTVPPVVCFDVWEPVCGCDGNTYSNVCYAARESMSIDHPGVCGTGACCVHTSPTGPLFCFDGTASECADAGGEFAGPGTACGDPNTVACGDPIAACCLPDGLCIDLPIDVCLSEQGVPSPPGVRCDVVFCSVPTGACCLPPSAGVVPCLVTSDANCVASGGTYQGDGTSCPADLSHPCGAPTGACCQPVSGAFEPLCEETTEAICTDNGGEYLGDGTTCPADGTNPCPPPTGACCVGDPTTNTAGCFVGTAPQCANKGGSYLGDGTECPPDADLPCGRPMGACCFAPPGTVVSTCAEMTSEMCSVIGGRYLGDASTCPDDPALACPAPCPALCGLFECVSGCGTIVQGVECLLFESAWGTFILSDLGGFGVGDRVHVTGCVEPFCVSICQQGDGCIHNFEISACGEVCGGFAGVECSAANEFCKFPIGTCGNADIQGVCTPIPDNGCPENYDPVCGCDGVTYGNACEAAAASMSIAHRGACDMGQCAAARRLNDPDPSYCPGQRKTVHIGLDIPAGTTVIAVEDVPPPGWEVVAISDNGNFDTENGKVKWGPFFAPFPQVLNYVVVPAAANEGARCFTGVISIDGVNRDTCGDQCLDAFCRPFMSADVPQPPCPNCPLSDCNGCDHGACQDGRISLCEVISYACSWKTGCNDDLSDMTRAAFIWKNGECYCWDDVDGNWLPSPCASSGSGLCSDVNPRGSTPDSVAVAGATGATATIRVRVQRDGRRGSVLSAQIAIQVNSPASTSAAALDFHIPSGWTVLSVGNNGEWDEGNRKIKWGPYFEDASRSVVATVIKTQRKVKLSDRSRTTVNRLRGFYGTVSFDGVNQPVTVVRRSTAGVR